MGLWKEWFETGEYALYFKMNKEFSLVFLYITTNSKFRVIITPMPVYVVAHYSRATFYYCTFNQLISEGL